jgi:Fe-S-cluster containining protein
MLEALDNDHGVCGRCQNRCCDTLESDQELKAPMSFSDVARIAAHTGSTPSMFATCSKKPPPKLLATLRAQSPSLAPLFHMDKFIHLKVQQDNSCVLLNAQGRCSLPRGVRPRYCALYPLWFDFDPVAQEFTVQVVGSNECQAVKELGSGLDAILQVFQLPWEEAQKLVQRTRVEIRDHAQMSNGSFAYLI